MSPDEDSQMDRKRKHEAESTPSPEADRIKRARSEPVEPQELLPIGSNEPNSAPREKQIPRHISPEAMALVKKQLSQLTIKNRGMKASMQEMREAVVGELMSIMKTRRIVIEQLGRPNLSLDMQQPCRDLLEKRKHHMIHKEEELISLEKLLSGHEAVLEHADSACMELEQKIKIYEESKYWDPSCTMKDFPQMSALARLTGTGTALVDPEFGMNLELIQFEPIEPSFTIFMKLPFELRLQIWGACLPGPRVITHDSRHNRALNLLGACGESRKFVEKAFTRVLSPGYYFPSTATSFTYINPDTDVVIRELSLPSDEVGSLFDLDGPAFNNRCFALFSGLSRVKHLALGFDLLNENGGELFGPLQACCPRLETLIMFPRSQLRSCRRHTPQELRFVDFDSNFTDYVSLRWDRCHDRTLKRKAFRGLSALEILAGHALQYSNMFPQYIDQFGQDWSPILKICMLTKWNKTCKGWQTRYMDTDWYSKGFPGEDGKLYRGFVESGMITDSHGEILSRYEGVPELFAET